MKNITIKFVVMSSIFTLLTGCGISQPGTISGEAETSDEAELSSIGQGAAESYITVVQAKTAALENAGLAQEDVQFVHIHLDSENGESEYDIEFVCQDAEYDYKINAVTGEILSMNCKAGNYDVDTMPTDSPQSADTPQGEMRPHDQDAKPDQREAGDSAGSEQITEDRAKQIALEYAGVDEADVQFLKIKLDYDDGRAEYEVEWHIGQIEYSCDLDAYTGGILSFEKELD